MTIPVWIQGAVRGSLSVSADGLYTLLRADCEPRKELIRLWAHSGGRSACIGVLAPCGGRLALTRRLSARERAAFPWPIERVDDRADAPEPVPEAAPVVRPPEAGGWRSLPDGSLLSPDGAQAIPASLPPSSPLFRFVQQIQGRDYLVFRR